MTTLCQELNSHPQLCPYTIHETLTLFCVYFHVLVKNKPHRARSVIFLLNTEPSTRGLRTKIPEGKIPSCKDIRGVTRFLLMALALGGQIVTSYLNTTSVMVPTFPVPLITGKEAGMFSSRICVKRALRIKEKDEGEHGDT